MGDAGRVRGLMAAALGALVLLGCALPAQSGSEGLTASPASSPAPTYTLQPTYTHYPTYTRPPTGVPAPPCPACPTCTPHPEPSTTCTPEGVSARVLEVIDGDTIRVSLDGHEEKVRYLAVDCPEIAHDDQPGERLGDEATSANARLVQGQTVWLVADAPDRDPYDRLLRWVWADGVLMNAELVRQGLAYLRDNADGSRYAALLHAAEREAQQAGRGLWAATPTSAPRPKPTVTATPAATPSPGPCSYVGNASSLIFHHASCDSVAKMAEGNKVCFASRDEAIGQGYRPCKRCNP